MKMKLLNVALTTIFLAAIVAQPVGAFNKDLSYYQIDVNAANASSTVLSDQVGALTWNTQPYIDNYYLNSSYSGMVITDGDGNELPYMPPVASGTQNQFLIWNERLSPGDNPYNIYLSQKDLGGNTVIMPGPTGITAEFPTTINIGPDDDWTFEVDGLSVKESASEELDINEYYLMSITGADTNSIEYMQKAYQYISIGNSIDLYFNIDTPVRSYDTNTTGAIYRFNNVIFRLDGGTLYQLQYDYTWLSVDNNIISFYSDDDIILKLKSGHLYSSSDNVSWSDITVPTGTNTTPIIKFNNTYIYVNVGHDINYYYFYAIITDGVTYNRITIGRIGYGYIMSRLTLFATNNCVYCVSKVANGYVSAWYSSNSTNWTQYDNLKNLINVDTAIQFNGTNYAFVLSNTNTYYQITSTTANTTKTLPMSDKWNFVTTISNVIYLCGDNYILTSENGEDWEIFKEGRYIYISEYPDHMRKFCYINLKNNTYQNIKLVKNQNTLLLYIDGMLSGNIDFFDELNINNVNIFNSGTVNCFKRIKLSVNDVPQLEWNPSFDGTLYDSTGNGNNATVDYLGAGNPDISYQLKALTPLIVDHGFGGTSVDPISILDPAKTVEAPEVVTTNWDKVPVLKELAKDIRGSSWPVDLVLSMVVVLLDVIICFVCYRFTRDQLVSGILALVFLGFFVALGCIPIFPLALAIVAELAVMTKRKVISY